MQVADDEEEQQPGATTPRRPDPVFSYIMNLLAKRLPIQLLNTKLPQMLVAYALIEVPPGREFELIATILDF